MSSVAKAVGHVLGIGGGGDGGAAALAASQKQQQQQIADQTAKTDAVLAGQQKLAKGGNGFLSFLDDDLKKLFGG